MGCVIVDTSSILFGVSNNVDVFEKVSDAFPGSEIVISIGVLRELKGLSSGNGRNSRNAKVSLNLIAKKKLKVKRDNGIVDDWIRHESASGGCIVCTNDTKLRRALRQNGVNVLTLGRAGQLR